MLSRSFRSASHSSSVRSRQPCLSTAEAAFFFCFSTLHSLLVTSSTVRSGVTCSIFFTISVKLMLPPILVIRIKKSLMNSPSLKKISESSFCSYSMLDSRTRNNTNPTGFDTIPGRLRGERLVGRDYGISRGIDHKYGGECQPILSVLDRFSFLWTRQCATQPPPSTRSFLLPSTRRVLHRGGRLPNHSLDDNSRSVFAVSAS